MWFNSLKKNKTGLCAVVFDGTDRIQHMFFRYMSEDHPANRGKDTERFKGAILQLYKRADDLLGRTMKFVDDNTVLFVVSDHGFAPFKRGINLNAWFVEKRLMIPKNGSTVGRFFDRIDWSKTKAYTFGLGGVYINLKGRERHGIVEPGDEYRSIKRQIINELTGLKDPETGETGILRVYDSEEIFPALTERTAQT